MRAETQNSVDAIEKSLALLAQRMDYETSGHRLEEFNARVEDPTLWDDPAKAQKLMRDRQMLVDAVAGYEKIKTDLTDNIELIELGEMEEDAEVVAEAEAAIKKLEEFAAKKELEALLDGEADGNDTFLEINSGAGGTESCDWANMLARMYVRWAEKKGYKVELQSETPGEEAGIKSAAYKISGTNAYGWLKSESGVHRLVRISPFDSAAKRHTSFTSVKVYPVVDDNIEIEVNPSDIRIDTYRSSGAGGQAGDAGWGNQIRSYVLQPYQMVKDLRTRYETSDTQGVLDGDLDGLMAATLAMDVSGMSRADATAED